MTASANGDSTLDGHNPEPPQPQPPPLPYVGRQTLPGLVRAIRRRADMSQRELAKAVYLARSTVAKLETGDNAPSLDTLLRLLAVANLVMVVTDREGNIVSPMRVWDETRDGGDKMFPAHLDLILNPKSGDWWGDSYGLSRPPETYHRERAYRDAKRALSQWSVRVAQHRHEPPPPDPDRPVRRRPP